MVFYLCVHAYAPVWRGEGSENNFVEADSLCLSPGLRVRTQVVRLGSKPPSHLPPSLI